MWVEIVRHIMLNNVLRDFWHKLIKLSLLTLTVTFIASCDTSSKSAPAADSALDNCEQSYSEKKWIEAFVPCQKAAEQGHASAQNSLGYMYDNGYGVSEDDEQAVFWYRQAANQKHPAALNNLGTMYYYGHGVLKDENEAISLFRQAAEQGAAPAQSNLDAMLQNADEERAPRRSYASGNTSYDCRHAYSEADWTKAFASCSEAAQKGNASAQANLGRMYYEGQGVPQDINQAAFWLDKAAGQGSADAQYHLGWMHEKGQGVPQDDEQSFSLYLKAAGQGHAAAQYNLGWMYYDGRGIPQDDDDKQVIPWHRKAAGAAFSILVKQVISYAISKHFDTTVIWLPKLKRRQSLDVDQGVEQASHWFHEAAVHGHAPAQNYLGYMYLLSQDLPQSYEKSASWSHKEAASWFYKAAKQGNADAQYNLAWMYKRGYGVFEDNERASFWFRQATEHALRNCERRSITGSIKRSVENITVEGCFCSFSYSLYNYSTQYKYNLCYSQQKEPQRFSGKDLSRSIQGLPEELPGRKRQYKTCVQKSPTMEWRCKGE